ncbi:MAG TPA: transcriptional regulator NrdR [Terrimicrobiaceae bacterium]|jgi:transcriptional repressor NrdR|nr:transcriptional regulator NrdR [Terrimicrobiaceae bacterium]
MRCPKCGSLQDKVIDSRLSRDGDSIRRRRECLACETRYTTYEEIERIELRAIKRDGRHEPFDRHKLLTSLVKACEKRPIGMERIERAVEELLHELESQQKREIPTRLIGAMVMEKLHAIDPIAYVRYASVYRQFQEIGDFIEEIQTYQEKRSSRSSAQPELFQA